MRLRAAIPLWVCALVAQDAHAGGAAKKPRSVGAKIEGAAPFTIGGIRYSVEALVARDSLGPVVSPTFPPAGSRFVTVWYTAENTLENQVTRRANWFYLRDAKGRRFTVSDSAQLAAAMSAWMPGTDVDLFDSQLPPGVRRSLIAAFVLPLDAIAEGLRIYFPADDSGGSFIEVWPTWGH